MAPTRLFHDISEIPQLWIRTRDHQQLDHRILADESARAAFLLASVRKDSTTNTLLRLEMGTDMHPSHKAMAKRLRKDVALINSKATVLIDGAGILTYPPKGKNAISFICNKGHFNP